MIRLNLQQFAGDKTEKGTGKKRQDARKKGQVVKSTELSSAITFLVAAGALKMSAFFYTDSLLSVMKRSLSSDLNLQLTPNNAHALFIRVILQIGMLCLPVMGGVFVTGILVNALQTRGLFTLTPLTPDLNRINPIKGFARMFSLRSTVEMLKSICKLTIVGFIIYSSLKNQVYSMKDLMDMQPANMLSATGSLAFDVLWKVGLWLLALGLFDFFYQRFDYEKSLRMTKQEVKDEYKMTEGNPLIKGKIKERQRMLAMRRMMQDVPKADVVITNPTHYAVALQYEAGVSEAPVVLAKGIDEVALRIKNLARENGVVIVENRPLAQSLYKTVDIGTEIPADLFQAVAEVLAYVYRLKQRRARA